MATYKVTLISEEHDINTTIDCNDDVFVLDAMPCWCLFYLCW
jgi:ferredoxin